jgi:3-isopropylmalate/(R)-2-methylmalate dehydratase large subunit
VGMTVAEKILARAAGLAEVSAGMVVEPAVDLAMSHENAALVMNQFFEIFEGTGLEPTVWDPAKIAIIFDHRVPAETAKTATNQKKIRDFVAAQGITKFHDVRGDEGGICHQILAESGYVLPGTVVVGTDSHTSSHGAMGAMAIGLGATDMAGVWALGRLVNVEVPPTIKVVAEGVPALRGSQRPDPLPDRHDLGGRGELPGDRIPRSGHQEHVGIWASRALQHVGGGRRHMRHRPGR